MVAEVSYSVMLIDVNETLLSQISEKISMCHWVINEASPMNSCCLMTIMVANGLLLTLSQGWSYPDLTS